METTENIKWKVSNSGNILLALYKGTKHCKEAVLTNDWQDRLEVYEYERDVYDTIVVKPSRKEGHTDFIFSTEPKWAGELTSGQWQELKHLPFSDIYRRLVGKDYEGRPLDFGKYKGQTPLWVERNDPSYLEWCSRTIPNFDREYNIDAIKRLIYQQI